MDLSGLNEEEITTLIDALRPVLPKRIGRQQTSTLLRKLIDGKFDHYLYMIDVNGFTKNIALAIVGNAPQAATFLTREEDVIWAVQQSRLVLRHVKEELRTKEVYVAACRCYPEEIRLVPEKWLPDASITALQVESGLWNIIATNKEAKAVAVEAVRGHFLQKKAAVAAEAVGRHQGKGNNDQSQGADVEAAGGAARGTTDWQA